MNRPGKLQKLKCGNGAIMEVAYQIRIIDYNIEDDKNYNVYFYKNEYQKALETLQNYLNNTSEKDYNAQIENQYRQNIDNCYRLYILELIKAQEEEKKAEGLL